MNTNPLNIQPQRNIHELIKAGNKVRVRHWRYGFLCEHFGMSYPFPILVPCSCGRPFFHFDNLGGLTEVYILDKNEDEHLTNSECSLKDNFCYKKGIEVALQKISDKDYQELLS